MTFKISRDWATPITVGSFGLLAVTGVLMFFHLDSGLNKLAHEWLSWVLLAAVGLHLAVNWPAFRRHLMQPRARLLMGAGALVLALSFLPASLFGSGGGDDGPPYLAPAKALAQAPLPVLAQVAGVPEAELHRRLADAGLTVDPAAANLAAMAGPDTRRQVQVLAQVLKPDA